jgi:hypothetical protein
MARKRIGNGAGAAGLTLDAYGQSFETLQHYPSIKGRKRWACLAKRRFDMVIDELLGSEDYPAKATPLPVNVLCGRIDDAIRSER